MTKTDGLTFEEYKASGESGDYRPDLDRYFLPGMAQPPLSAPITQPEKTPRQAAGGVPSAVEASGTGYAGKKAKASSEPDTTGDK